MVGSIPRQHDIVVPSRHLGLVTAIEHGEAALKAIQSMENLSNKLVMLIVLAHSPTAPTPVRCGTRPTVVDKVGQPTIAMAGGPAFTFGYAEHRELLEAAGATVVVFDPLQDTLPACDGLIIPGGFPEEHVVELAARQDLRSAIAHMVADKKPIYGECAGMLWLLETLNDHPMLGVIGIGADMGHRLTFGIPHRGGDD